MPRRGVDPDAVDTEALRAEVRRTLRGSKTPERIVCWAEIPRTPTGKLVRREAAAGLAPAGA